MTSEQLFDVEYATADNGFATMDLTVDEAIGLALELHADPGVNNVTIAPVDW